MVVKRIVIEAWVWDWAFGLFLEAKNAKCLVRDSMNPVEHERTTYRRIRAVGKCWKTNWRCFSVWYRSAWTGRTRSWAWVASASFATGWRSSIRCRIRRRHWGATACHHWSRSIRWHSYAYWWAGIRDRRGRNGPRPRSPAIPHTRAIRRRFVVWEFSVPRTIGSRRVLMVWFK